MSADPQSDQLVDWDVELVNQWWKEMAEFFDWETLDNVYDPDSVHVPPKALPTCEESQPAATQHSHEVSPRHNGEGSQIHSSDQPPPQSSPGAHTIIIPDSTSGTVSGSIQASASSTTQHLTIPSVMRVQSLEGSDDESRQTTSSSGSGSSIYTPSHSATEESGSRTGSVWSTVADDDLQTYPEPQESCPVHQYSVRVSPIFGSGIAMGNYGDEALPELPVRTPPSSAAPPETADIPRQASISITMNSEPALSFDNSRGRDSHVDRSSGMDSSIHFSGTSSERSSITQLVPLTPGFQDLAFVRSVPICQFTVSSSTEQLVPGPTDERFQQARRKRRANDEQKREHIKQIRRAGACLRCRIYKEKCDLQIPCFRCVEVLGNATTFKQPCVILDLRDVVCFRTGNSRAGVTESLFPKMKWSFDYPTTRPSTRITHITQNFPNVDATSLPSLALTCRRFIPGPNDVLVEPYQSPGGDVILVASPPFACLDITSTKTKLALNEYVKKIRPYAIKDVLSTLEDDICCMGILEAERFARTHRESAVDDVLELLACIHINFKQPIMVGDDTLDVQPVNNPGFQIHGKSPVPSVLDYQVDTLYIDHMKKLMKRVSKYLKSLIFKARIKTRWYEIYLIVFVQLVALETVYVAQYRYLLRTSKANDDVNIFAQASSVSNYMNSLWTSSAKNLLYHFRCVMKGTLPFDPSHDLGPDMVAGLNEEDIAYIHKMRDLLRERREELNDLFVEDMDNVRARSLVWLVKLFYD